MHRIDSLAKNRVRRSSVLAALLACAGAWPALAGDTLVWTQVAAEDGIVVDQQPVEGRGMPRFRGRGEVAADVQTVLAIVSDTPSHTDWMPDCAEARVLRVDGDVTYVYRRTSAPWPVSDRDVVIASRVEVVEPDGLVLVHFESVDDETVAVPRGVVRMPLLRGHYRIERIDASHSTVELLVDADPGGSLPGSIAAATARDNPLRTLIGIRGRVAAYTAER